MEALQFHMMEQSTFDGFLSLWLGAYVRYITAVLVDLAK